MSSADVADVDFLLCQVARGQRQLIGFLAAGAVWMLVGVRWPFWPLIAVGALLALVSLVALFHGRAARTSLTEVRRGLMDARG